MGGGGGGGGKVASNSPKPLSDGNLLTGLSSGCCYRHPKNYSPTPMDALHD